jgi:mRNA interferase HigB
MFTSAELMIAAIDFLDRLYQIDIMRLIGRDVLSNAARKHADARKWLEAWIATVEDAGWQSLDEVRDDYPSADGVKLRSQVVVTVFNVKGNEYRLLTNIIYQAQVVLVLEVLTHSAYDKEQWKGRY